ncbi:MAG: hypothetical protein OXE45_13230, partial [bacterium]|nr:hypothetical protein [bacterium]
MDKTIHTPPPPRDDNRGGAPQSQPPHVSPEEIVYTGEAEMVVARTTDAEIAFQPRHVPLLSGLVASAVHVST